MTTPTSLAASLVVAISLALPATAIGQAVPRGSSGGSSKSEPASPSAPAPAHVRTASPASQPAPSTRSVSLAGRTRGVRAAESTARPRPPYVGPGGGTNSYYYGPGSYPGSAGYYPYYPGPTYGYGFHVSIGLGYGYGYSPYGYAPYYGLYPYNPFFYGYSPYYYQPYGYAFSTSYQSYGGDRDNGHPAEIQTPTGSLRLRASPSSAKVYIDGALAGSVDDFDGLTGNLKVEAGTHELELRAEGYRPYAVSVTIDAGKTRTERATLKKN